MSNNANKFEQMLEKLTADDRTGAEALFHEIVVEKSRSIYENLLETDLADIAVEETAVDEAKMKKDKEDKKDTEAKADSKEKEEMKKESTTEVAAETAEVAAPVAVAPIEAAIGGDATDDMIADIEDDKDAEDKDEEKPEAEIENKIVDLEDAVEELKAEFEKLMSNDGDKDAEDKGDKDEALATEVQADAAEEVAPVATTVTPISTPVRSEDLSDREKMREYVDKVAVKHTDGSDNVKSPTPKQAKAMGGNAVDFVGSEEKGRSAPKAEQNDAGNINTPGASIKLVKAKGPVTADKADNTKSILGSK